MSPSDAGTPGWQRSLLPTRGSRAVHLCYGRDIDDTKRSPPPPPTMTRQTSDGPNPTIMWIIWGALLASLPAYGGVLPILETQQSMDPETFQMMLIGLAVAAVSEIPVIFVLRKMLFFGKLENGDFEDREAVGQQYYVTSIVTWALCESIAIYGFVLSFMSGKLIYYPAFAAVGAALMILFRPKLNEQLEAFGPDESGDEPVSDDESDQEW